MTSRDFVIWLRGFTAGVHKFNTTPEQWDTLKDELAQVKDAEDVDNDLPNENSNTLTTPPFTIQPWINPPYTINCGGITTTTTLPKGTVVNYTNGKELLKD
jgi:hypothetical protein